MNLSIIKKLISYMVILFIAFPRPVMAIHTEINNETKGLSKNFQEKVIKGYSSKFCNAVGMGMSINSAIRLTIQENSEAKFNPSLWIDLIKQRKKQVDSIDPSLYLSDITETIFYSCGNAINIRRDELEEEIIAELRK